MDGEPTTGSHRRMQTSIATVSLSGTLNRKLIAIANAGYDGVEIFENDFRSRGQLYYMQGIEARKDFARRSTQFRGPARKASFESSIFWKFVDGASVRLPQLPLQ